MKKILNYSIKCPICNKKLDKIEETGKGSLFICKCETQIFIPLEESK